MDAGGPSDLGEVPDMRIEHDLVAPDVAIVPDTGTTTPPDLGGGPDLTEVAEVCNNGVDDNGDGELDCFDAECAPTPACGMCAFVATPTAIPQAPLDGEANPGRYETASPGNFSDDYVYNSANTFKIGTRREWGGTVVFFGQDNGAAGMNNTNAIDANDTGREVQVAFYDKDRRRQNCAWNASCESTPTQCSDSIQYLGWNPVQGGNLCNAGSGVESVDFADGVLTVSTLPLFWNPDWDRMDCMETNCNLSASRTRRSDVRIQQRLRFVREHVAELEYTVTNLAAIDHDVTAQEFPTVYTANGQGGPDLWRLFDSNSSEVAINQPAPTDDGFMFRAFNSPRGWVSMQNDDLSYGLGHYMENRLSQWTGWQLRSLPFNNFRPTFQFAIPANGVVRGRSYLILGSLATVAAEANWLDQNLPPFGSIDTPAADERVGGDSMLVRGWALDNKSVSRIEASTDGNPPTNLGYGVGRPDVCLVWPKYADCTTGVGYSGMVDISGLDGCAHVLEVRAFDNDGNSRVIERRRFVKE